MKKVAFLRHAKSDWGNSDLVDFDRPLAERGIRNVPEMGAWIGHNFDAQLALISPALRALQTYEGTGLDVPNRVEPHLYPTQAGNVLRLLQDVEPEINDVLIIGHNPGISRAVVTLLDEVPDDPKLEEMPTCACAILKFKKHKWSDLNFGDAKLVNFMTPKRLAKHKL